MKGMDASNVVPERTRSPARSPASPKLATPIIKSSAKKEKNDNIIKVNNNRLYKKLPPRIKPSPVSTGDVGTMPYCYMRAAGCSGRFLCKVRVMGPNGVDTNTFKCVITWLDEMDDPDTKTNVEMKDVARGNGYYKAAKRLLANKKA